MTNPFLDRHEEISITRKGTLPHWHQDGKIQYITFRLADSIPQQKLTILRELAADFKSRNPEPWSAETVKLYRRLISRSTEKMLDNGYGQCILRRPEIREIVEKTIMFKDGTDYRVISYVIMPNHVHLLLLLAPGRLTHAIMHSIKSYSSSQIKKLHPVTGSVWQRESYDHIVRNLDELEHCIAYIRANPHGLPSTDFSLYTAEFSI